jgi:C1A family cysteine protease
LRFFLLLFGLPFVAVLIGILAWFAWRRLHHKPLPSALIVVAAAAAPASVADQSSLQTLGPLLAEQGIAVGQPGSIVLLGAVSTPNVRAVFTIIDQRHPAQLYLIGLSRHQASTLYFHTRTDKLSVFVNAQPGAIAGPADLAAAVRSAQRYQPRQRRHGTGGPTTVSVPPGVASEDTSGMPEPPASASIDLRKVPPVGDQGEENSCVGWSAGYYYKTFQEARKHGWNVDDPHHQFSPAFIYNQINGGKNDSSSFQDAFHILKDQGEVPLPLFPYKPGDYLTQPDPDVVLAAAPFAISEFRHLYVNENASQRRKLKLSRLKRWLASGDGFVFAMNLPKSFNNSDGGVYDDRGKPTTDAHCMFAVGYDDNVRKSGLGAFRVVNSWGKNWGENGYLWISYEVFEKDVNEVWTMHAESQ